MPAASAALVHRKPTARSRITNGADILPGVDGRSLIARRYRDIAAQIAADQGGADRCSEARAQLIRRFAAAAVMAEAMEAQLANGESIDVAEHALLSSTLVRLASRIGIDRRAKNITPTLREYLSRSRSNEAAHHRPALLDPNLLGAALGDAESWSAWVAALRAAFGLPLDAQDLAAFARVAGNRAPPARQVPELWAVIGRRGGKSRIAAAIATYIAAFVDHRSRLAPGEIGYVLVLAPTQAQARSCSLTCGRSSRRAPSCASRSRTSRPTRSSWRGNIAVTVHANRFRSVRGRTLIAGIFDEVAFWRDETSASPDVETYRAILPALATTGGMLVGISSPYRRLGPASPEAPRPLRQGRCRRARRAGPTTDFNPMLDTAVIERARACRPRGRAQPSGTPSFAATCRRCSTTPSSTMPSCTAARWSSRRSAGISYLAFTDASAGRHDAFTLCIGHRAAGQTMTPLASSPT